VDQAPLTFFSFMMPAELKAFPTAEAAQARVDRLPLSAGAI
jgi:hypothetical protein